MDTILEAFAVAQRHHRAGQLVEADRLYREILAVDPKHLGYLHFLGVMAHQSGRSDIVVHLIGQALAVDPGSIEAHVNLANTLKDRGNLEEAIGHCQLVLAQKLEHAETDKSIGVAVQL